jgi:hypothetical protein
VPVADVSVDTNSKSKQIAEPSSIVAELQPSTAEAQANTNEPPVIPQTEEVVEEEVTLETLITVLILLFIHICWISITFFSRDTMHSNSPTSLIYAMLLQSTFAAFIGFFTITSKASARGMIWCSHSLIRFN